MSNMKQKKLLINGEWRETRETFAVKSPYTNKTIAEVSTANADEIDEAIAAAENAKIKLRKLARFQIAKGLRSIADGIETFRCCWLAVAN